MNKSSSVEMGNSLEQQRADIGLFNARSRTKREAPDCLFWVTIKDLLVTVAVLQLLIVGILAIQLSLVDQPSIALREEALVCPLLVGKVINQFWRPCFISVFFLCFCLLRILLRGF